MKRSERPQSARIHEKIKPQFLTILFRAIIGKMVKTNIKMETANPALISPSRVLLQFGLHTSESGKSNHFLKKGGTFKKCHTQ